MTSIPSKQNVELGTRIVSLDLLRIIACFLVILLHVSAEYVVKIEDCPSTFLLNKWQIGNIYNALTRSAVPLFVMISGAFMLDPNRAVTNEKIKNKFFKLVQIYLFWSVIYLIFHAFGRYIQKGNLEGYTSIGVIVMKILAGSYHMWFFYLLGGLYILVPLFRVITKESKLMHYFLVLSFLVTFFIPNLQLLPSFIVISTITDQFDFQMVKGYSFYFVFGYFLKNYFRTKAISKKILYTVITSFILAWSITVYGQWVININRTSLVEAFYNNFFITTMIEAFTLFVISLYLNQTFSFRGNRISKLASYTMGMYLLHALVLSTMSELFFFSNWTLNAFVAIPLVTVAVFLICWFGINIMTKIPFIGKFCYW